jgi:hypothetical protein
MTLQIDPEFRALIPPLTTEERAQLEANILRDGSRDALVVWNGVLLDGHHRYDICTTHNIPYRTVEQPCADRDAAKLWILQHQLGRRNLNDFQRAELAIQVHPLLAKQAEARRLSTLKQGEHLPLASKEANGGKTSTKLAALAGISKQGMERSICLHKRGSPELQEQVRRGEIALSAAAARVRGGEAIHPPRWQPSTTRPSTASSSLSRKEDHALAALVDRLDTIAKELHQRRVANDDNMRQSRWNPVATSIFKQREMLDWIQTTLETLVNELHAREHKPAHPRVPQKPRHRASTGV